MNDKRYLPMKEVVKGLDKSARGRLISFLDAHPRIKGVRYHRDGSSEDFFMESSVIDGDERYYHFALINAFKATQ